MRGRCTKRNPGGFVMKKFLSPGILAVLSFFLPLRSQAVPLDVPYQIYIDTVTLAGGQLVISTNTFPSPVAAVNANILNYQWCLENVIVNSPSAGLFQIASSTSTLTPSTTDYYSYTQANVPLNVGFNYRTPYCAPQGNAVLRLTPNVAGSTMTVQGYLWKGWNP